MLPAEHSLLDALLGADVLAFQGSAHLYVPPMLKSTSRERLVFVLRGFFRKEIFGHRGAVYINKRKGKLQGFRRKSPVSLSPSCIQTNGTGVVVF